jgi:hypothetical protein
MTDYKKLIEEFEDEERQKKAVWEVEQRDMIQRPKHYEQYVIEPVSFIMKNGLPFWMGNVIKYIMRAGYKSNADEITDLRKAKRYIDMRINQLEGREPNAS